MTPFPILATDRRFHTSAKSGDPACLCSRCGKPIAGPDVRAWPPSPVLFEYRYHPACVGMPERDAGFEIAAGVA